MPSLAAPRMQIVPPSSNCRLCGGETAPAFDGVVLGRHRVQYLRCLTCASLETETPHWLHDAYADGEATANLAEADTGAAQRNLQTWAGTMVVAGLLGLRNIVDFGGGDGLLVRLLRDHGLNAFVSDEYAAATYARGFTRPDFARPDLVTAFEVIEHFADPAANLAQIFGGQPRAVLLSTLVYDGQGADWWYLAPHGGQHVFFYSERGLQLIAERYGYVLVRAGFYTLFVRPEMMGVKVRAVKFLLRGRVLQLVRAALVFRKPTGVAADFDALRTRNNLSGGMN